MKVPSGSILHNLNPFSWMFPMKEALQSPKYGRFFSTPLQRHSVFSWYSDIHECKALPVTTQPTGIAGISHLHVLSSCRQRKVKAPRWLFPHKKRSLAATGQYSTLPSCSNRAVTGSYWSRAPCGHGPHWDGESQRVHGWVADDATAKGLASDIQGLFAFQSVHTANIGKTKLARDTG